jgi:hypothetical protein
MPFAWAVKESSLKLKFSLTPHHHLLEFFLGNVCAIHRPSFYSKPHFSMLHTTFCGFTQPFYTLQHKISCKISAPLWMQYYDATKPKPHKHINNYITLQTSPELFRMNRCVEFIITTISHSMHMTGDNAHDFEQTLCIINLIFCTYSAIGTKKKNELESPIM